MANFDEYNRYLKVETKILPDGREVYASLIPITIAPNEITDLVIVVNEVDRLDIIAQNVYGDPHQWWRIAAANHRVNGGMHVQPGTKLVIPSK